MTPVASRAFWQQLGQAGFATQYPPGSCQRPWPNTDNPTTVLFNAMLSTEGSLVEPPMTLRVPGGQNVVMARARYHGGGAMLELARGS